MYQQLMVAVRCGEGLQLPVGGASFLPEIYLSIYLCLCRLSVCLCLSPLPWTKTMHSLTSHRRPELGSSAVGCLRVASSSLRGRNHLCSASQRPTPGASSGGGGAGGKLNSNKPYAASLLKRAPDGGRS